MTCALELRPYFDNNEDPWKKIGTLSTEIGPTKTKIVKFWPKKQISVRVLKTLQMNCALELKPTNNEDRWKKLGCHNTKKPQNRKRTWKIIAYELFRGFWYLDTPFFSPILIIYGIRLNFKSSAHLEHFKYLYWYMLFWPKFDYFGFSGANFSA